MYSASKNHLKKVLETRKVPKIIKISLKSIKSSVKSSLKQEKSVFTRTTGKKETRKKKENSVQKRKMYAKRGKYKEKCVYLRATTGTREKKEEKDARNEEKLSKSVQNAPKIMKNHENGSERSPRDKSGAFGFENMFWPLGNVARPEGVTGGVQGWGQDVYTRMGIVGLVCVLCTYMHPVAPCTYVAPVSSLLYL